MSDEKKCETCRWFAPFEKPYEGGGFCRRYPPRLVAEFDGSTLHYVERIPTVQIIDFCGEHQPKAIPHA